jgi:GT2 family glycosyltransferase
MKTIKILASVVLFNPNNEEFLQLFSSFLNSKFEKNNIEFFVYFIDNSATESTFIKEKIANYHSNKTNSQINIYYIHAAKNLGYGEANNFAFNNFGLQNDNLICNYFLVINPDITFNETLLESLITKMENNKQAGLSSVKILNFDNSVQYVHRKFPSICHIFMRALNKFVKISFINKLIDRKCAYLEMKNSYNGCIFSAEMISGCFMCFDAKIYQKLNGFNKKFFLYYEDLDISFRAKKLAENIVFTDIFVFHKWKRCSTKNLKLFFVHLRSFFQYFFINRFKKFN